MSGVVFPYVSPPLPCHPHFQPVHLQVRPALALVANLGQAGSLASLMYLNDMLCVQCPSHHKLVEYHSNKSLPRPFNPTLSLQAAVTIAEQEQQRQRQQQRQDHGCHVFCLWHRARQATLLGQKTVHGALEPIPLSQFLAQPLGRVAASQLEISRS